jgi:transcription initiation factor TFIIIB Brf1 subunit/transcription initiation factor TFIIB
MTKTAPLEDRRDLQKKLKRLKPRLAKLRLKRELARILDIHPNTMDNYLDGFCSDLPLMGRIIQEANNLLTKVSQ